MGVFLNLGIFYNFSDGHGCTGKMGNSMVHICTCLDSSVWIFLYYFDQNMKPDKDTLKLRLAGRG